MRAAKNLGLTILTAILAAVAAQGQADRPGQPATRPIFMPRADAYPLSEAVRVGDTIYLSGRLGTAKDGPNGIAPETRRAMDSIGTTLAKLGLTHAALVKCTVMLTDMAEWDAFNAAYAPYFAAGRYPARTVFAAAGLANNGRVEIECVAQASPPQGRTR